MIFTKDCDRTPLNGVKMDGEHGRVWGGSIGGVIFYE